MMLTTRPYSQCIQPRVLLQSVQKLHIEHGQIYDDYAMNVVKELKLFQLFHHIIDLHLHELFFIHIVDVTHYMKATFASNLTRIPMLIWDGMLYPNGVRLLAQMPMDTL